MRGNQMYSVSHTIFILIFRICEHWPEHRFIVTYQDEDNDLVTMDTDEELQV